MDRHRRTWISNVHELLQRPLTKWLLGGLLHVAVYQVFPFLALLVASCVVGVVGLKIFLRGLQAGNRRE